MTDEATFDPALLPYLAGYFDADGNVGIAPPRDSSFYLLQAGVTSVIPEPLYLFRDAFRGKVIGPIHSPSRPATARPVYRWSAETHVAENALRLMLPWLTVKRERAALALEFRRCFKGEWILPRGVAVHLHTEKRERILAERRRYYDQMRILNRRGQQ